MENIEIKGFKISLSFEIQTSPSGRPFRYSGVRKSNRVRGKWIDKVEKYHWIYTFRYMDSKGGFVEFESDYNDKFIKITKL